MKGKVIFIVGVLSIITIFAVPSFLNSKLWIASYEGDTEFAEWLLTFGADPDESTSEGLTCLMAAASNGHTDIVRMLIENGANINAKSKEGWTAMDMALIKGRKSVVNILLNKEPERERERVPDDLYRPIFFGLKLQDTRDEVLSKLSKLVDDGVLQESRKNAYNYSFSKGIPWPDNSGIIEFHSVEAFSSPEGAIKGKLKLGFFPDNRLYQLEMAIGLGGDLRNSKAYSIFRSFFLNKFGEKSTEKSVGHSHSTTIINGNMRVYLVQSTFDSMSIHFTDLLSEKNVLKRLQENEAMD